MTKLTLFLGSDHAAFKEKKFLKNFIGDRFPMVDCGTDSNEKCDYPQFAGLVAQSVQTNSSYGRGILLCGSGIGVSMVANRYAGIRAALCRSTEDAILSVQHNNSNILCLGARVTPIKTIQDIFEVWIDAQFEGGRHSTRIAQFDSLGEKND